MQIQIWTDDERLRAATFPDMTEALRELDGIFGEGCEVGNVAGEIVDANGEVVAEYGEA